MKDEPLYYLLRKARIKTENQLIDSFDSSWKYCPDTGRSTVAYTIFYQGCIIDNVTNVTGPVSQSGAESYYNS